MVILNGNALNIRFADNLVDTRVQISNLTNVSLDIVNNLVEVTTEDTNTWKEHTPGIKSVQLSFDAVLDASEHYSDVDTAIEGSSMLIFFGAAQGSRQGTGFLSNVTVTGGTDDRPTINGTIEITGRLRKEFIIANEPLLDQRGIAILDDLMESIFTLQEQTP